MEKEKIKYSIIVPVYNAQRYIERCINSVFLQTETNWELILIDDGSKDGSGEICQRFAALDTRVKYLYQENKGVSAARNKGLDIACGEWITFMDSDDWVEPFHLATFNKQVEKNVDLCINSFIIDLYYGVRTFNYLDSVSKNKNESLDLFLGPLKAHSQFLWIKAFKSSIINKYGLRFDVSVSLGEDNIFILSYLLYVKTLSSTSIATYHYDQIDENQNSLGRKKRPVKDALHQIKQNTTAIYSIYEQTGRESLLHYSSDYYYTRVFERILVQNKRKIGGGFFYKPALTGDFRSFIKDLRIEYDQDRLIRFYWLSFDKPINAFVLFNYYIIRKCLTLKTIRCVVAAKHVVKRALRHA